MYLVSHCKRKSIKNGTYNFHKIPKKMSKLQMIFLLKNGTGAFCRREDEKQLTYL